MINYLIFGGVTMKNSKNFNLFLMAGEVTGRIKCTLSNWTGLAYKVPRSYLEKCKDRQEEEYIFYLARMMTEIMKYILAKQGYEKMVREFYLE